MFDCTRMLAAAAHGRLLLGLAFRGSGMSIYAPLGTKNFSLVPFNFQLCCPPCHLITCFKTLHQSIIMLSSYTFLLAALSTTVITNLSSGAEFVPQIFDRTTRPAGGWSLSTNSQEQCPSGVPQCGASWCCPASLTCVTTGDADIAEACCPGCKFSSAT